MTSGWRTSCAKARGRSRGRKDSKGRRRGVHERKTIRQKRIAGKEAGSPKKGWRMKRILERARGEKRSAEKSPSETLSSSHWPAGGVFDESVASEVCKRNRPGRQAPKGQHRAVQEGKNNTPTKNAGERNRHPDRGRRIGEVGEEVWAKKGRRQGRPRIHEPAAANIDALIKHPRRLK